MIYTSNDSYRYENVASTMLYGKYLFSKNKQLKDNMSKQLTFDDFSDKTNTYDFILDFDYFNEVVEPAKGLIASFSVDEQGVYKKTGRENISYNLLISTTMYPYKFRGNIMYKILKSEIFKSLKDILCVFKIDSFSGGIVIIYKDLSLHILFYGPENLYLSESIYGQLTKLKN
jgi:hypothetical protein